MKKIILMLGDCRAKQALIERIIWFLWDSSPQKTSLSQQKAGYKARKNVLPLSFSLSFLKSHPIQCTVHLLNIRHELCLSAQKYDPFRVSEVPELHKYDSDLG